MAKYKIDNITSQEELDALIDEIRSSSKMNHEDAAARTQAKLEALEANIRIYQEELQGAANYISELEYVADQYENDLYEAYSANDTYELADMLQEHHFNPKFNDLVIQAGGLHSDMSSEEFGEAISRVKEAYPEFALNEKQPSSSPEDMGEDGKPDFDTSMTYQ